MGIIISTYRFPFPLCLDLKKA